MEKLYDYILKGIKESGHFYDDKIHHTFEEYLASLQNDARDLWESFRKPNKANIVEVDYSNLQTQAVYLIRYYPSYLQMTLTILRLLPELFTFGEKIEACFFGGGPCPEVAGLAKFLEESSPHTKELVVNVYDLASNKWTPSRTVTKNFVLPQLWKGKFSGTASDLDFCKANSFEEITKVIEKSHLFVFQNCLNEIWNAPATKENIKFLLDRAPKDSFIIIADLLYYQNRQIVEDIAKTAEERRDYKILVKCDEMMIQSSFTLPEIIEKNLLTGEDRLIPKKRINFFFLALKKIR